MATTFVPSQYLRLYNLVQRAAASPSGSGGSNNEWYIAVDGLRSELVDLGRIKSMNDTEAKEMESGELSSKSLFSEAHTPLLNVQLSFMNWQCRQNKARLHYPYPEFRLFVPLLTPGLQSQSLPSLLRFPPSGGTVRTESIPAQIAC